MSTPEPVTITPHQAAQWIGIAGKVADPERFVLRMARMGELTGVRVGKFTMISVESVVAWIRRNVDPRYEPDFGAGPLGGRSGGK